MMLHFPDTTCFKYPWRAYQKRVLEELEDHIDDRHLHVVAPPGSGKTVLGLEVAVQLNKPVLILAPTLTIRNQWIQRLCELFLQTTTVPDWVSVDIRKPAFMTVVTYQGLHAACCNKEITPEIEMGEDSEDGEIQENVGRVKNIYLDKIVEGLKEVQVGTLVIDEAHHLRNEWWNTLIKIKDRLDPITVGLTATPPYDVNYTEWKRYIDLNGPIDAEIAVPELVMEGDLCAHQDHLCFSLPTTDEYQKVMAFRNKREALFEELSHSDLLEEVYTSLPAWQMPEENMEWVYSNFDIYTSLLIFFHHKKIVIPRIHLTMIDEKASFEIPKLEYKHMERLLDFFLFSKTDLFTPFEEEKETLKHRLQRQGVIDRNKVILQFSRQVDSMIFSSLGKIDSIETIAYREFESLGSSLRMVVLTDYIRNEYLNCTEDQLSSISKIGVLPIFQRLRYGIGTQCRIGVLTGSLILIPRTAFTAFQTICANVLDVNINSIIKAYDEEFILIVPNDKFRNRIVAIITRLFEQGDIHILVGTKALLGEGWDAPCINSLIMASFVGSFMLSNQMRGRAIRSQKNNPNKCSNIWHLVCVDPSDLTGGNDLNTMKRRFRAFVGISREGEPTIENGIDRLRIPSGSGTYSKESIESLNATILQEAANREQIRNRWIEAIQSGRQIVEEIKIPFPFEEDVNPKALRKYYLTRTIALFMAELGMLCALYMEQTLQILGRNLRLFRTSEGTFFLLATLAAVFSLLIGDKLYKAIKLYLKYSDISKDVRNIGKALLVSLIKEGTIHKSFQDFTIVSESDEYGAVFCHLKGATTFEQNLFTTCLEEITNPVDNPRYLITRKNKGLLWMKKDYHAVPDILGKKKENALYFAERWKEMVGKCDLTYTRTIEGRSVLLKARVEALAAVLNEEKQSEQVNRWR